jgi:DNA ligase-1
MSKQFKPLLAVEADLSKLRFPLYLSPKLDGIRTLILNGKAVSRNLKPIPNKYIRETLEAHADVLEGFDGELIVGNPCAKNCFNVTSSAVMSFDGEPDFKYHVFDKVGEGSYKERWEYGTAFDDYDDTGLPEFVNPVVQMHVNTLDELNYYEKWFVEKGYEGVMTRSPEGFYKFGRSTANEQILLKIKRFKDSECQILGFEERMSNQNEATTNALGHTERSSHLANMVPMGTLGALIVKDPAFDEPFKIGTGFDDKERQKIWDTREELLSEWWKYKFQECGVKDKPRFPVSLGRRYKGDM